MTGEQIAPEAPALTGEYLEYEELSAAYDHVLDWLARTYVNTLDVIHYMHDKYAYERIEMALHDHPVHRKLGAAKYEALGIPFPLRDTPAPDPALTERVREQFREQGVAAY